MTIDKQATRDRNRVIANTREILAMAENGYRDAIGTNPTRRRSGIMNMFTYGRTVTLTMQTMKSVDPDFEAWWKPYQAKMSTDALMRYFNTNRTDIIHEGHLDTSNVTKIGAHGPVNFGDIMPELNKYAPPNTVGTFFGDQLGGNGWEVAMPDGSKAKVYFDLPASSGVESHLELVDPPTSHYGMPIFDTSIASIGGLYLETLRRMVSEFEQRFGESASLE